MKAQAEIRIGLSSDQEGRAIFEALKLETNSSVNKRSSVEINLFQNNLQIVVKADDTIALRAAMNSYLRWFNLLNEIALLMKSEGSLSFRHENGIDLS